MAEARSKQECASSLLGQVSRIVRSRRHALKHEMHLAISANDRARFRAAADARGLPLAEWIRRTLRRAAEPFRLTRAEKERAARAAKQAAKNAAPNELLPNPQDPA